MIKKQDAFTLIEMIIAITVFTVFIGFVMTAYMTFHQSQQEAAIVRSVIFEMESATSLISQSIKENSIDYEIYSGEENLLYLLSPDETTHILYIWDDEDETLGIQLFDSDGNVMDGYAEPVLLHSEDTKVTNVKFRIFPSTDPYGIPVNSDQEYYQPNVQMAMTFERPGRIREDVVIDFQTSVTSRIYQ